MAHLSEGYYLALYQQVKAVERRKGRTAISGAIFGVLLDYAMDYTVQAQRVDVADDIISGDAMYSETMKRLAAMDTAQGAYYGIRDVIDNMRVIASSGRPIDPRLQFEPVADAQGMILCAQAALEEECYDEAHKDFKQLYQRGLHTAPVACGLAKTRLGDFAFGASPAELYSGTEVGIRICSWPKKCSCSGADHWCPTKNHNTPVTSNLMIYPLPTTVSNPHLPRLPLHSWA